MPHLYGGVYNPFPLEYTTPRQGQFKIDSFPLHSRLSSIVYVPVNKKMQQFVMDVSTGTAFAVTS